MSLIKGRKAENIALKFLKKNKLILIEKNYFSKAGEIDLIMSQAEEIIFIEVRARKGNSHGSALDSIDISKQRRISKTAQYFLYERKEFQSYSCRFDALVINQFETEYSDIEWIKDAFWPGQSFSIL